MRRKFVVIILSFALCINFSTGASIDKELIRETFITVTYEIDFNAEITKEWKRRSIASRFNNPGNLRCVTTGKFRSFDNLLYGYEALLYDIECKQTGRSRYADSATTLNDFIHIYAPPFENNTTRYVRVVCEELDIDKFTPIGDISKTNLARAIIRVEDPVLYSQMFIEKIEIKENYRYD